MGGVVKPGCEISRERTARHVRRHHHLRSYAAIVLRGGYIEAGDRGRFRAEAGDVLWHRAFEGHQDHFGARGADILNIDLPRPPGAGAGRLPDPDAVVRAAETSRSEAAFLLLEQFVPSDGWLADWPDLLAAELGAGRPIRLSDWAEAIGLAPSSVSRGFRLAYGVSPQTYRAECRAARAARALASNGRLVAIAAQAGFADQSHMTRLVARTFGRPPGRLRAHVNCVQDGNWAQQ